MILVTGATGNVGSQVVRELRERGEAVRAFVRDRDRAAEKLGSDIELAIGDLADAASVRAAVEGADAVLVSSADGPQKVEHEKNVIDASVAAGAHPVVKVSTISAEAGSPLPPFDWNGRSEDVLWQAGVPAVVLQSSFYMTNLLASAEQIRQTGKLFAPAGEARIAMIDPRDVAAVAAVALTEDGHEGQTYVLSGPEAITYADVAAALGVEFVDVPDDALRQGLTEAGMPDWLVSHLTQLFPLLREGLAEQTTDTVERLTGRHPRSFREFARDYAPAFAAP